MVKIGNPIGVKTEKLNLNIPAAKRIIADIPKRDQKKPVFKDIGGGGKIVRKKPF